MPGSSVIAARIAAAAARLPDLGGIPDRFRQMAPSSAVTGMAGSGPIKFQREGSPNGRDRSAPSAIAVAKNMLGGLVVVLLLLAAGADATAQTMTIPGKLEVGASGAATYTIPIVVPPGTAGMTPPLSLEYSSQSGDGIVGMGWSLGGLPSVGRCPQTIAQDGVRGSLNYDGNDRFCLAGQRLIAISGAYGADGTEYRTEIESFSRVISHGASGNGPAWFEVHAKSGQSMEFGNTADSRILAQGTATARAWAVNKVSDTKGNYFSVGYVVDAGNGQAYPSSIVYTGNAAAGLSPYNSVQFVYTGRTDVASTYIGGSLVKTLYLISEIKTYSGATLVADYRLAYQNGGSTPRSKLASVTLCDGAGSCLPPTSFTWQGQADLPGAAGFTAGWGGQQIFAVDFNGDGKTDIFACPPSNGATCFIYYSNGAGGLTQSSFTPAWGNSSIGVGDFNGDGMADLFVCPSAQVGGACQVYYSNGTGFTVGTFTQSWPGFRVVTGDFNGDGLTDLLVCQPGVPLCLAYFSTGTDFTPGGFILANGDTVLAADFNGDGRTDIFMCPPPGAGACSVHYASNNVSGTETGFVQGSFQPGWAGTSIGIGDFNGDGNSDLFMCPPIGGGLCQVFYSTGTSFVAGSFQAGWSGNQVYTADLNGDGKSDLFLCPPAAGEVCHLLLSTGDSFTQSSFAPGWPNYRIAFGDWAGSGVSSLLAIGPPGGQAYQYITAFAPELVASVSNGLTVTTISYLPLTNPGVYTKDTTSVYPIEDMGGPIYVVSRVDASNGIGGTYSTTYLYAGAKADMSGRGFLGFRVMQGNDLQTGISQVTTYRQDFPYLGLVGSAWKANSAVYLNIVTNTYGSTPLGGTRAQVFLSQSVAASNDLDGTSVPTITTTYQYDAFGNATQVAVSTPDGYSKTTNNTYTNDTTRWLLGRLTAASVTSVVPASSGSPPPPPTPADLTIAKSHSGSFQRSQTGAAYTITVSNVGPGPTRGTVEVTDSLPSGLTATAMSGSGWTCTLAPLSCNRGDALAAGASYPPIALVVTVAANAPDSLTNVAIVSGGDETNTANNTASDPTAVINPIPDMTVSVAHSGNFVFGQVGAIYTITARNSGFAPTSGTVTVTDTLPAGLAATAMAGTGWACTLATRTCTRSDALAPGAQYPAITLTVNVSLNATASVTNTASVAGGGEINTSNDGASDPTSIVPISVSIAASANNFNLWGYLAANGLANGGNPSVWNVTIGGGLVFGATSSGAYAFDTGAFPAGSRLTLNNYAIITGAGGTGGNGGNCSAAGTGGNSGGPGLRLQTPVTLANYGSIWGGAGGGGGGGGGDTGHGTGNGGGGGGGGAGYAVGNGGPGGSGLQSGAAGSAAGLSAGGAGGAGAPNAGAGGSGGGPGQAGAGGAAGIPCLSGTNAGGPGGAAGGSIVGSGFITWSVVGDVRGPLN